MREIKVAPSMLSADILHLEEDIKKVEAAKKLLETTSLPISSVMEKVGFYDASYFSKLFKKTVGYSPRGYRDNITDLEV